ncbi:MAG: glycosyl transferase family protein [Alphaproteobacteria bacterium]
MSRLADFVRILGRGPSRARSLTRDEAREAMTLILSGAAEREAVGALLMLMRYRGETAAEIAGFVDAARAGLGDWAQVSADLDWPSYAAGRSRGLPWFLLSAKLVAGTGYRTVLHGWNSHQGTGADVRAALAGLNIPVADTPAALADALDGSRIAYLPLEGLSPDLFDLLRLRDSLGLRSAVNTVLRVLNPCRAPAGVQGVFHPPYRDLQQEAALLLGQPRVMILKGGGGEFERHPSKSVELYGVLDGVAVSETAMPLTADKRRLADTAPDARDLPALWRGDLDDPFAEAVVTGTAAAALLAAGHAGDMALAQREAVRLWRNRADPERKCA